MAYQLDSHDFYDVAAAFSSVSRRINLHAICADASRVTLVIDVFRDYLKNEDRVGFFKYYNELGCKSPDLFDFLMEEVFATLNIDTVDELL